MAGVLNERCVYSISDAETGRVLYIGKASDAPLRWRQHRTALARGRHYNVRLQRRFNRDGRDIERLAFAIIETCDASTVDEREIWWIRHHRESAHGLYNVCDGGEGGTANAKRPDVRAKLSAISKAKWADPIYRARWSKATGSIVLTADEKIVKAQSKADEREATRIARMKPKPVPPVWVPITIRLETVVLPLTNGRHALVDAKDWPTVAPYRWHAQVKRGRLRAKRSLGKGRTELLSRRRDGRRTYARCRVRGPQHAGLPPG